VGGGELARDADVEVTENMSTLSLMGVPGWVKEVILGRLDACLLAPTTAEGTEGRTGTVDAGGGSAGGVSVLGVSVIRRVLGWVVLLIGDPVDTVAAAGVPGRELIEAVVNDPARDVLVNKSGFDADAEVETLGESSLSTNGVVSILSFPG